MSVILRMHRLIVYIVNQLQSKNAANGLFKGAASQRSAIDGQLCRASYSSLRYECAGRYRYIPDTFVQGDV